MIISRLIDKNFSEYEDEKLYSVLMDEEELRLYSEFLEEREFAKVPVNNMYGIVKTTRLPRIKTTNIPPSPTGFAFKPTKKVVPPQQGPTITRSGELSSSYAEPVRYRATFGGK